MSKIKKEQLSERERIETLDVLYTAAGSLRGREAMKRFLRDLLTESERFMLGRRILIARMLLSGVPYEDVSERLRVGHDTIGRVQRWLSDELPGYENAIEGLRKEHEKRKREEEGRAAFARMKRKHPLHFLLFPWPKGYGPKGKIKQSKREQKGEQKHG